jgi:hypothetical protein
LTPLLRLCFYFLWCWESNPKSHVLRQAFYHELHPQPLLMRPSRWRNKLWRHQKPKEFWYHDHFCIGKVIKISFKFTFLTEMWIWPWSILPKWNIQES